MLKIREASKWVVPPHLMWRLITTSGPFLSSTRLLLLPLKTPESMLAGTGGTRYTPSTSRDCLESDRSPNPIAPVHRLLPRPCPQAGTPHSVPSQQPACSTFKFTSSRHCSLPSPWRLTALGLESRLPDLWPVPSSCPSSSRAHSACPALCKHPWASFLPPCWMSIFHLCVWLTPLGLLLHVPSTFSGFSELTELALRPFP